MRNFWQDVRYGLRVLSKSSGFAVQDLLAIPQNCSLFVDCA